MVCAVSVHVRVQVLCTPLPTVMVSQVLASVLLLYLEAIWVAIRSAASCTVEIFSAPAGKTQTQWSGQRSDSLPRWCVVCTLYDIRWNDQPTYE